MIAAPPGRAGQVSCAPDTAGSPPPPGSSKLIFSRDFPSFSPLPKKMPRIAGQIAPQARAAVYPNSLPWVETPQSAELPRVVFSANFEYHPNIDAVGFLVREIWPLVRSPLSRRSLTPGRTRRRHLFAIFYRPAPPTRPESRSPAPSRTPGPRSPRLKSWSRPFAPAAVPESRFWKRGPQLAVSSLPPWPPRDWGAGRRRHRPGVGRTGFAVAKSSGCWGTLPSVNVLQHTGVRRFESCYSWETVWKTLDNDLQPMRQIGVNRYTKESDALRS